MATGTPQPKSGLRLLTDQDSVVIEEFNPIIQAVEANAVKLDVAAWTSIPLINGWIGSIMYYVDANRICHVRGRVQRTADNTTGVPFNIPSAIKPVAIANSAMSYPIAYQNFQDAPTVVEPAVGYTLPGDNYFRIANAKTGHYVIALWWIIP